MIQPPPHTPMTLLTGPINCVERECPEHHTPDGYNDPTVERCSHVTTTVVCGLCSIESDHGFYDETTPWPCPDAPASPA